jgi:hypothetical protein
LIAVGDILCGLKQDRSIEFELALMHFACSHCTGDCGLVESEAVKVVGEMRSSSRRTKTLLRFIPRLFLGGLFEVLEDSRLGY